MSAACSHDDCLLRIVRQMHARAGAEMRGVFIAGSTPLPPGFREHCAKDCPAMQAKEHTP